MSSNRRSYNARKRRGALTRSEHLAHAKKRGQLATFRPDPEANRQLQKEFNESGAYRDTRHDKSIRKSNDPKFSPTTAFLVTLFKIPPVPPRPNNNAFGPLRISTCSTLYRDLQYWTSSLTPS